MKTWHLCVGPRGVVVREEFFKKEDLTFHLMPSGEKCKLTLEHTAGMRKRGQKGAAESQVLLDTGNEPPRKETWKTIPFTGEQRR